MVARFPAIVRLRMVALAALIGVMATGTMAENTEGMPNMRIEAEPVPLADYAAIAAPTPGVQVTGLWRLSTGDARFGGISAMMVYGDDLLLVSDRGNYFRFRQPVSGQSSIDMAALAFPEACTRGAHKRGADAESAALGGVDGEVHVGFERTNQVCAFHPDNPDAVHSAKASEMEKWPRNRGAEAMATLPDGDAIVLGEAKFGHGNARPLLYFHGNPASPTTLVTRMFYRPPPGFKPADAAALPDGRVLVLNRRSIFPSRNEAQIVLLDISPEKDGWRQGKAIATIVGAPVSATFEAMTVQATTGGMVIWLASDNNFSSRAKTVLMRLAFDSAKTVASDGSSASMERIGLAGR